MKVPYFNSSNYGSTMSSAYSSDAGWLELKDIVALMDDNFVSTYSSLDSRNLVNFFKQNDYTGKTIIIGGNNQSAQTLLTGLKLLIPTLWNCNYFTWDIGKGGHHGVDIILPQSTPLPAFLDGSISRVKVRDGKTKNEGNCVVLKSNFNGEDIFICYEHLDKVAVAVGDSVTQGQTIGYCGTTGNSTQYHLHLQIDKSGATFHPYRSSDSSTLSTYTYDPIKILRQIYNVSSSQVRTQSVVVTPSTANTQPANNTRSTVISSNVPVTNPSTTNQQPKTNTSTNTDASDTGDDLINQIMGKLQTNIVFTDMPENTLYATSIQDLFDKGIIKGNSGRIFPDANIKRYEFALLMQRFINKMSLNLGVVNTNIVQYTDVDGSDAELGTALQTLYKYGVMKGSGTNFFPDANLKGEEVLAVLGRMMYQLTDATVGNWYDNYLNKFVNEGIIKSNWSFIGNDIDRKEVFLLINSFLQKKSKI